MESDAVRHFTERVNTALSRGANGDEALGEAAPSLPIAPSDGTLTAELVRAFRQAYEPEHFFDRPVYEPNQLFAQCYELMRITFDEAERDPIEQFVSMLQQQGNPENDHPLIMIGRFWRVLGAHEYDEAGNLTRFSYEPMSATESIVGLVSGNYMSLRAPANKGGACGAIGHLATRERFRGGRGHGADLLRSFEAEVQRIAATRGESVRMIVLEAQTDSVGFWYKQGYRWAVGTNYSQPPLEFDPETGERLHDEVPETLMVKVPSQPNADNVESEVLADVVYTMYWHWCLEKAREFAPPAAERAERYVMSKVYRDFMESLPATSRVHLGPPPTLEAI